MVPTETLPTLGVDGDRAIEPAFPLADHGEFLAHGLSQRELFAAMAMQGLVGNYPMSSDKVAAIAVKHADALLAELQRQS